MALESPKARGSWAFVGASINVDVVREVDQVRGEIPRSRIVERALRQYLERETSAALGERRNNS